MNKKDLRKMVQEEIRRELYSILPQLLKEAVNSIMIKEVRKAKRTVVKQGMVREGVKPNKDSPPLDRTKLAALIGYGDMRPGAKNTAPIPDGKSHVVAGIQIEGGLLSKETEMGVAHMRDYSLADHAPQEAALGQSGPSTEASGVEEAHELPFANVSPQPGGVDGGAEVPAALVAALGKKSKAVLTETERQVNWRPGMKRSE